jgi:hypothetical protein
VSDVIAYFGEEGFEHRNGGRAGRSCQRSFESVDEAKSTPFPDGCTFAYIPTDAGSWVHHSAIFRWEFFPGPLFSPA